MAEVNGKITFKDDSYSTTSPDGLADNAGDQSRIETCEGTKLARGAGGPTKVASPREKG